MDVMTLKICAELIGQGYESVVPTFLRICIGHSLNELARSVLFCNASQNFNMRT